MDKIWITFSILLNIILVILVLILFILYINKNSSNKDNLVIQPCNAPVCPAPEIRPKISTEGVYTIRTLNGLYLKGCFGCLDAPVACIEKGIVASPVYVEDKFKFIPAQNNFYQIQYIKWEQGSILPKLYLNMVRKKEQYQLCLTENPNQTSALFEVLPYFSENQNGVNLYQIGSVVSGSLIGEGEFSCLIKEGIPIVDGYNLSPNAPNGLDDRSLFFILPA
jgi:hypothetical protein